MNFTNLIEGLKIFLRQDYEDMSAEHDLLYFAPTSLISEESEDGMKLKNLGFLLNEGYWVVYV